MLLSDFRFVFLFPVSLLVKYLETIDCNGPLLYNDVFLTCFLKEKIRSHGMFIAQKLFEENCTYSCITNSTIGIVTVFFE
jgi:hypothetical protein